MIYSFMQHKIVQIVRDKYLIDDISPYIHVVQARSYGRLRIKLVWTA